MKAIRDPGIRIILLLALAAATIHAEPALSQDPQDLAMRLHAARSSYADFEHGRARGLDGWWLGSRIWLPAEDDPFTLGLFRLDPEDEDAMLEDLLDGALDFSSPDMGLTVGTSARTPGALSLPDATTHRAPRPAEATGNATLVTHGMHGGALHLGGGNTVIRLPNYDHRGGFTVEAWFKPDAAAVNAMLGSQGFILLNADDSLIPEEDPAVRDLRTGNIKIDDRLDVVSEADRMATDMADDLLAELDAEAVRAADPDGHLMHENFDYQDGILRLRILHNDYRLIKLIPQQR